MKAFVRIFPKFSEIEAISIVYIFVFALYYNFFHKVGKFLIELYSNITGAILIDILILIVIFGYAYKLIHILWKSAFTKEKLKDSQRAGMATTFYILSSLVTLIASFELFMHFEYSLFNLINSVIIFYILLRSLYVLASINALLNYDPRLITEKFDERQTNKIELTILVLVVPVIYIFLNSNYSFFTTLALTYIYTDLVLNFFRNLLGIQVSIH